MPYIKVNISRMNGFGSSVAAVRIRVNSIQTSFLSIGSALDWDVKACADINRQISQINNELSNVTESLKRMENFFAYASKEYDELDSNQSQYRARVYYTPPFGKDSWLKKLDDHRVEKTILNNRSIKTISKTTISDDTLEDVNDNVSKVLFDMAKKFGFVGSVISVTDTFKNGISKLFDGNSAGAFKDLYNAGKNAGKTVSAIRKKIENLKKAAPIMTKEARNKNIIRAVFGFDNYFDPKTVGVASKAKSASTRIYNNFQKTWTKELGDITKANIVVSGLFNAISNYSEMKSGDIGVERMVAETIGETAVDVTVDAALSAGTAAVLAGVVGTTAVPVVAVASIVVAAKWSADTIVRSLTDKDSFTEWVSDGLLDLGEKIGNAVPGVIQSIKDGTFVSKVRDACTDTVNNIKDSVSDWIGNAKESVCGVISNLRQLF